MSRPGMALDTLGPRPALTPPRSPLPAQTLVELLKQPFCVGEVRRLILDQLRRHSGRPFADQWDFAAWAETHTPQRDLRSPPRRPGAPE